MRKLLCTGFLLGVLALALGAVPAANAFSSVGCTYQCTCSGQALKCCPSGGTQFCQPTNEIGCTQQYNC